MKFRRGVTGVGVCLGVLVMAMTSRAATTYYVNDNSTNFDIYTTVEGNNDFPGTSSNAPKLTLASVLTNTLAAGDVIYIDTGTYAPVAISNTVAGAAGNLILFIGSTNTAAERTTTFTGSGTILDIRGKYLKFQSIRATGGSIGFYLNGAQFCEFEGVHAISNQTYSLRLEGASNTNQFRRSVFVTIGDSACSFASPGKGNYFENSIIIAPNGEMFSASAGVLTNIVGCVGSGRIAIGAVPEAGSRNVFYTSRSFQRNLETLADMVQTYPNWQGNTFADPLFVDQARFDFHLLSGSGYVSNGIWVINAGVGFSPAIDFSARSVTVGSEPDPNGGRANIGLYGGTVEASMSRTNAWLYAMSFNDGGNLVRTGRLEWVASTNFGPTAKVDLQFSTNNGATWSNIATTVGATNENYLWIPLPEHQHPAVLWRVVDTNAGGTAATNAKPFSVRVAADAAFTFYVNDDSTNNDLFCSAAGSDANLGVASNSPKRSLQALVNAYDLEGGDIVYVDTGMYSNETVVVSSFDSGSAGKPLRIIGSPSGTLFTRNSTSAHVLELQASNLEIENLQLTGGNYGLYGNGSVDVLLRNMQFLTNQFGVRADGRNHVFEHCLSAENELRAFSANVQSNLWLNGVMWGKKAATLVYVTATDNLRISNSILGCATNLFGSQPVRGDYNLVWDTGIGATFGKFSALQAGGLGWSNSLYADPLFIDANGGDFHLASPAGCVSNGTWITNVTLNYSPAIDRGDPGVTNWGSEPVPNGDRLNAGLFGGTVQASQSRTNAWLQALSFMDGGTLIAQAGAYLRWDGGQFEPDARVTIWLSRDAGSNWVALATNVAATNREVYYQNLSTNDPSSLYAQWKVTLDGSDPEVVSQTPTNFAYKNGTYAFYVNDSSTNGDVYCTALGNDNNLGVTPGTPMASLTNVLGSYTLGPGDRIYVDTGAYTNATQVGFTSQDSGTTTNPVVILGSTNRVAGGSVFGNPDSNPGSFCFVFMPLSSNIVLQDMVLTNVVRGVAMTNTVNVVLDGVEVRGATLRAFDLQGYTSNTVLRGCVAHGGGVGVYLNQVTNIVIRHSVLWNNTNALYLGNAVGALLENSILASTRSNSVLYSVGSLAGFRADYNGVHAGALTRVATNRTAGTSADNLAAWQALSAGHDLHSIPGDPLLANPDQWDYHLKTEKTLGRRLPNGQQATDTVSSPLLDAGNPTNAVAAEPEPNGGRVNIGRHGGSAEASIARDTPWLMAAAYGDQGMVTNGRVSLHWTYGGGFTGETAQVEVSTDGGKTWGVSVTSGVPVTNGMVNWDVASPDTPAALWRIVCLGNTNVWARTTNFFAIRNSPLDLFIATANTNDAFYTTAPGLADNWTAASNAPLNSAVTAFDRFDLEPGDRLWVDPGIYEETAVLLVGMKDSGTSGNPVEITGSPLRPYDGTVWKRASRTVNANGIQFDQANSVHFSGLMVSNAWYGIWAGACSNIVFDRVRIGHCVTNSLYTNANVVFTHSIFDQNLFRGLQVRGGSSVQLLNCLVRDSGQICLELAGGDVEVKNSILIAPEAMGTERCVYYVQSTATRDRLRSNFNDIRVGDGANVARYASGLSDRFLIDWQISTSFSNDMSSFGYDPQFADEAAQDYHLKSAYGRYAPAAGEFITNEAEVTSFLIDLGDPDSDSTEEPEPNGNRINVGIYGNTAEASKSSGSGTLVPLTMSDGGTVRSNVYLYWTWNNLAGSTRVNVDFSADGGLTWTNLGNEYVSQGTNGFLWNTTNSESTAMGVWRIITTNEPVIEGRTETLFAVKNKALEYYVNDSSTNGDVYCFAAGSSTNSGLSAQAPMDTLARLLGRYKVEHGDTVYVDTGLYPRSTPLVLVAPPLATTNYLIIQGSTNEAAGGTVLTNSSPSQSTAQPVFDILNSHYVELRDLRLHGGDHGLRLQQSNSNRFLRVRSVGARINAFDLDGRSDQNWFIQCAALNFSRTGFHAGVVPSLPPPTNNFWSRGVLASAGSITGGTAVSGALIGAVGGRLYVSNSALLANSPAYPMYAVAADSVRSDYNCYYQAATGAPFAVVYGPAEIFFGVAASSLGDLEAFAAWNLSDSNSFGGSPLFADLANGDLHPKSAGGRYSPALGDFVLDEETSPLIDTADPALDWSLETGSTAGSNGGRANIGPYGGTAEASRTPTNSSFVLQTLNEGGVVRGIQPLKWRARGFVTNAGFEVDIRLSTNSGADNYPIILTTVAATTGVYQMDTTTLPSAATFRWRVQSINVSEWRASSERDFIVHNSNLVYYVNDSETNGDIYCTAPGAETNSGVGPDSPLASLSGLLARFDLEPGDTVYLDSGTYAQAEPLPVGFLDSGTAGEPVVIQGSTNYPGSRITGRGLRMINARGLAWRNVAFVSPLSPQDAILVDMAEDITCEQLDVLGAWGNGFSVLASSNITIRNSAVAWATTNGVTSQQSCNTRLEFCTIWSNRLVQVQSKTRVDNRNPGSGFDPAVPSVSVSNSALMASGTRNPIYHLQGNLSANNNNLTRSGGALVALVEQSKYFSREFDSVGIWAAETGRDPDSLTQNPQFADVHTGDFHLKSSAGRYDPVLDEYVETDPAAENSPLIDAGDRDIGCTEPDPNGGRVNIGRHGNTGQASKTPTNGSLTLVSFNDGGRASGTNVLVTWLARGATTGATVTISYSADGGATWSNLVSGFSAATGAWTWNSTNSAQSVQAKIKIVGSDGTEAENAQFFSVRNGAFEFFINDANPTNDVYCSSPGNNANSGLSAAAPKADLNALLKDYDLESGDIVYIDTGIYRGTAPWRITQADSAGDQGLPPVIIQGSTNPLYATVLECSAAPNGIRVDYAIGVRLRNLTVSNTVEEAVVFHDCYDVAAEWVRIGLADTAFRLSGGESLRVSHGMVADAVHGVVIDRWNGNALAEYPVIEHNVFWETQGACITLGDRNSAEIRHNIFSVAAGQYVFSLGLVGQLVSDYNSFWLANGGRVFWQEQSRLVSPVPRIYATVGAWAAATSNDLHSYEGDPLLVDPDARNFYLQSKAGRWDPVVGWTNDAVSSPLIDAGDPDSTAWTDEPAPNNGGRVNIGLYGGSPWASQSDTNTGALHLRSLNRGGIASGAVALNWIATGPATGHLVRVEVSMDEGANWIRVADGVAAALEGLVWNSLSAGSSPRAIWRVQDLDETNLVATSELVFVVHNGPISYYVNDEFPSGDIYCSEPGATTNSGVAPDAPKRWLAEIVDTYDLEPGDIVYVDTGRYQTADPTTLGDLDAGWISHDPAQQVTIQGSTNALDGGSLFILSTPDANGIQLQDTYGVRLRSLDIIGASNGVTIANGYYIAADWLRIRDCYNGVSIQAASNILFTHAALIGNQYAGIYYDGNYLGNLGVDSSLFWSNRYGIYLFQGGIYVTNTIMGMSSPGSFGYYIRQEAPDRELRCDYNNLYLQNGAAAGGFQSGGGATARTSIYASVSAWSVFTEQDSHSLAHDPLLADPGNDDFHLRSAGGRWLPGTGWTNDSGGSSPLIDAGSPQSTTWTEEPYPHGRRINMGLYGGTPEASKTPTAGSLTLLSLNDGGSAAGMVELKWEAGGDATNFSVCLDYSPDNGNTWSNIVCDWPANSGSYPWDSVPYGRSVLGRWRVSCQPLALVAMSMTNFMLRNGGMIPYYVNDASTNGDVYCTAPGSDEHNGLTPATPMASLQALLDLYELAPEDVAFVDAGTYPAGAPPLTIGSQDSGWSNLYVTIQGSTNPAAPTVFQAPSLITPVVLSLNYAVNVKLKNLTIRGGAVGVDLYLARDCIFDEVRVENNSSHAVQANNSDNLRLVRSVIWKQTLAPQGAGVLLSLSQVALENCTLWGCPVAVSISSGSLTVTNSILEARGPAGRIYRFGPAASVAAFRGDYNAYFRQDNALIAEREETTGNNQFYDDMLSWNLASQADEHSLTTDPLFANVNNGDFHPKSPQGRFLNGAWTNDAERSPLIDAGAPGWTADLEPPPNGGYINIGAHGGTGQASMTQTNPPWLQCIALNEGGVLSGSVRLYWLHGGMPGDTRVQLDYSMNEVNWYPIATNLTVDTREHLWDVSAIPQTLAMYWRVMVESDPGVFDVSDNPVAIKTRTSDYYINDGETNGDVWCKGPGLDWDPVTPPGTNAAFPLKSLTNLLANYPVGAGDTIYIDTGTYMFTNGVAASFESRNAGTTGSPLRVFGSTNFAAGGARFVGNWRTNCLNIQNTRNIEINDLRIERARSGLALYNAVNVVARGLDVFDSTNGVWVSGGGDFVLWNSRLWNNHEYGFYTETQLGNRTLRQSTLWGNRRGAVWVDLSVVVSNCILGSTNAVPIYTEGGTGGVQGDYNLFYKDGGGGISTNARENVIYANLREWQEKGLDLHSFVADPLFANAAAGDFHLQSRAGYWSNWTWQVAADTSWAIDAGDPDSQAFTNEPTPHGGRLNLGAYGGTPLASPSDDSVPELFPITLRDGGIAPGGQPLLWLYRGLAPTNLVTLQYSPDGGASWRLVDNSIAVNQASYIWQNWEEEPTPEAQWRLFLQTATNIGGATPALFILRPRPIIYYVNDASTNGDVYTGGLGSPANLGYTSNSPLSSVQQILSRYQLLGGDQIKVDTGVYPLTDSIVLSVLDSGVATSRVSIVGSTNLAAGGSRLEADPEVAFPAFKFEEGARDIDISHFHIQDFTNAVFFVKGSARCGLADLDIQGALGSGVYISQANNLELSRVLIREGLFEAFYFNGASAMLDSCVAWSNLGSALILNLSTVDITNSVLEAAGSGQYCYYAPSNATVRADYNNLYVREGARIATLQGVQYEQLPQWVRGTAQDRHSFGDYPWFNDPANGDFHPQSPYGRFDPGAGHYVTNPAEPLSPLIDMGPPPAAWSNEPGPNGGRRNIGLYGNTPQASQSDTNQWLRAITASAGGLMFGRVNLIWNFSSAVPTNEWVQLEYSYDNGEDYWVIIATNPVGAGEYSWQSDLKLAGNELWPSSPAGRWRLILLSNPDVLDMTDQFFGLRNSPFKYFVNDTSTVNDVYTTNAPGSDSNWGFLWRPKATLKALLESVDFEPTDEVYIDTGIYPIDSNTVVRWEESDGGRDGQVVQVRASYHPDGSWFVTSDSHEGGMFQLDARDLNLRYLRFAGDVVFFRGSGLTVSDLQQTNGALSVSCDDSVFNQVRLDRGALAYAGQNIRMANLRLRWGAATMVGTNIVLSNSVIYATNQAATGLVVNAISGVVSNNTVVSTRGTALSKRGPGTLRAGHNILMAGGTEAHSAIDWVDGALISDWNNVVVSNTAWIGVWKGKWEKLAYWQAASGQDSNSVSFNPKFQNMGSGDFHLNSEVGRWNPDTGLWDTDPGDHSPVIDLGNPVIGAGSLEPLPNGNRRNLGAYGGTTNASLSRTNFWLTALTQNDGGVLKGANIVLRWTAGGNNIADKTVTLQYSADGGATWTNIASGLSATAGSYAWDSTTGDFADSFAGRWQVVGEGADAGVADATDDDFALRNSPASFYVNDGTTNDDIYCSAAGSAANDGLDPARPKESLQQILDAYDLEGGDTVYVDAGGYSSSTDIRVIWSRSGNTNAEVVIVGHTNGAHTVLTRSGSGGTALDVKASWIRIGDLAIQGAVRGILLESNVGVTVQGLVVSEAATGVVASAVNGLSVLNSAFWRNQVGVSLLGTRTSVLENLTFALPTLAGIRLSDTAFDTLQNNIFIPETNATAYAVEGAVSLLANAEIDYNLYDFSQANSALYEGSTNNLRSWQLNSSNDFRSAFTNHGLAEIEYTRDFHPLSMYGRWTPGGWVADEDVVSWAVDHGNPASDYSREPTNHGGRINIGRYGNTPQASQGSTNIGYEIRTLNEEGFEIRQEEDGLIWPLVWSAHLLDPAEMVYIQLSIDGGSNWNTLATQNAYSEYYIWQADAQNQTENGLWRVIGVNPPYHVGASTNEFKWRLGGLEIFRRPYAVFGLMRFDWRGGVGGYRYRVEYSDDFGKTWNQWPAKYNGPAVINRTDFTLSSSELFYTFEDRTSYLKPTRWYRIWELQE